MNDSFFILKSRAHDKNILMDYEKALEDFDKEDITDPNLANILKTYV
jgi:hypothetical protein